MQKGSGPIKENVVKRKKVGGGGPNIKRKSVRPPTTENGGETPSLRPPETYGDAGGFHAGL